MSLNKTLYFIGVFEIKKTQLTGVSRGLNDKSNFDYFLIKKNTNSNSIHTFFIRTPTLKENLAMFSTYLAS